MYEIGQIIIIILLMTFGVTLVFKRSKDEEKVGRKKKARKTRTIGLVFMVVALLASISSTIGRVNPNNVELNQGTEEIRSGFISGCLDLESSTQPYCECVWESISNYFGGEKNAGVAIENAHSADGQFKQEEFYTEALVQNISNRCNS